MKIQLTYGGPISGINLRRFIITLILLALWIPVLYGKAEDFEFFRTAMLRQYFPLWFRHFLIGFIPIAEAAVIILLANPKTNLIGMWASSVLMLAFTGYVGLALASDWVKIPCGCMKVLSEFSWKQHFLFNLFFLALSGWGLVLSNKMQSSTGRAGTAEGGSAKRHYTIQHFMNLKK
ncbi:MauE/DoxX family redox-associated membrane protein [Parapedobacter sp. 10938]|uniref:MauE/DoxX family redox-associated membrane protein n=1 Tax=Parapedobacter flavus TaxID=3110225 RepID=UPI002DBB5FD9|nr:MauE/DoxX family redox-associated membrane protein [Parapedobacter sp. 10938]MEC3881611.1 MauE/DoxX family redox-associated membrane protein [Parapedobacter sp. 10938]